MRPIAETGRPIYLFGESLGGMLALYGELTGSEESSRIGIPHR